MATKKIADRVVVRMRQFGYSDSCPGVYHLAADLLAIVEDEVRTWTNRADDAVRIPDVIGEAVREVRRFAEMAHPTFDMDTVDKT